MGSYKLPLIVNHLFIFSQEVHKMPMIMKNDQEPTGNSKLMNIRAYSEVNGCHKSCSDSCSEYKYILAICGVYVPSKLFCDLATSVTKTLCNKKIYLTKHDYVSRGIKLFSPKELLNLRIRQIYYVCIIKSVVQGINICYSYLWNATQMIGSITIVQECGYFLNA